MAAPAQFSQRADEILNGIDVVANDPDMSRTLTAPTFRIKLLQIGGE